VNADTTAVSSVFVEPPHVLEYSMIVIMGIIQQDNRSLSS